MSDNPNSDREFDNFENAQAEPSPVEQRAGREEPESPADRLRQARDARQTGDEDEVEEELWEGSFSSRAMIGKWVLAGAVTVILPIVLFSFGAGSFFWWGWLLVSLGLWGYFALQLAYHKMTVKYRLTTQRFIHQSGLLKRLTDRIEVIDIDDVSFEQGIVERIIGVGSIKITSSDRSHPILWMRGIDNVNKVATLIDDTRRKERRRRGLHIEAI